MSYKVIYHIGNDINIRTKAQSGSLSLKDRSFAIYNSTTIEIPYSSMVSAEKLRINGLGTVIKVICSNKTIYLSVIRLNIAGYFVIVNYFRTIELFKKINANLNMARK